MSTLDFDQVDDVLVYEDKVVVKTELGDYEFDREEDDKDNVSPRDEEDVPDAVTTALDKRGFSISPEFPNEVTVYAHDEATPYDRKEIANDLGVEEGHDLAERIAGLTYEISLTVKAKDEETAVVTHYDGHELKEPKTVY